MTEITRKELHDLRNQLNNISMSAELGKMRLKNGKLDSLEESLQDILRHVATISEQLTQVCQTDQANNDTNE